MDRIVSLIKEELDGVNKIISSVVIEPYEIRDTLRSFIDSKSKRIRTIVASLYLRASGKSVSPDSLKIMAAGELIHNASLLHDDVLDNAQERRGEVTIGNKYSPNISILSGDYILSAATEILLKLNNNAITEKFMNCTRKMCNAEIHQYFMRGKLLPVDDYIKICEGKTAKLFETVIGCCAMVENLKNEDAVSFAVDFGILFQLKNDLEEKSEKQDKNNNILTLKNILGIEKTSALMDNYLERLYKKTDSLPDNVYKKGLEDLLKQL